MNKISFCRRFALASDISRCGPLLGGALAAGLPPADWNDLRVIKALPRNDGGFTIQYAVPLVTGGVLQLGGHLVPEPQLQPAWTRTEKPGVAWFAEPGLAVAALSCDPVLDQLPVVLSPAWLRSLGDALGWHCLDGTAGDPVYEVLAYRLEKRCVLRVDFTRTGGAEPGRVIVKVVRRRHLERIVAAHEEVRLRVDAEGGFSIPRVLHVDTEQGVFAMAEAVGETLHTLVDHRDPVSAYADAGRLLRDLHKPSRNAPLGRTAAAELAQLQSWTASAAELYPAVSEMFAQTYAHLVGQQFYPPAPPVMLHRDFYDKQILVGPNGITLLDLDMTTVGDPALDLGNFLAHVRLRQLQAPQHAPALVAAGQAFLVAYGPKSGAIPRIRWWRAAALLRLAALYAFRPRWRNLTPTLLKEVDTCLQMSENAI